MSTFKAYFKKEILESKRQYRYLILALGIIIFAIADPIMLKLLPKLMKNQLAVDINSIMKITPEFAIRNYIKDLVQVGSLIVIFTLSNILSEEITSGKLVFPYSKGSNPEGMVLAKILHYSIIITIFIFAGFLIAYYYVNILFTGEAVSLSGVLTAATLMSMYYFFIVTSTTLLSSILKKGIVSGFLLVFFNYMSILLIKVKGVGSIIPYKLVESANTFSFEDTLPALISVTLCSILFIGLTIYRMNKVEVI